VMFETNERSWHGFPRIDLPPDKRHLSRKSISIYLYTRERPADEIAPMHGTFYVQRPLPGGIAPGYTLTEKDVENLGWLLSVRDSWITAYQRMELDKNREIADKGRVIQELKMHALAPLTGYLRQEGAAVGLHGDGWVASHVELQIRALVPVSEIVLRGYRPESAPGGRLRMTVSETAIAETTLGAGSFELAVPLPGPLQESFRLSLEFESGTGTARQDADQRDLAFVMMELTARHTDGPGTEMERARRELAECVARLHAAEKTIDERTAWAQRNAAEVDHLRSELHKVRSHPLVRLAAKLRLLS